MTITNEVYINYCQLLLEQSDLVSGDFPSLFSRIWRRSSLMAVQVSVQVKHGSKRKNLSCQ